ncbi:kinase-like domain-containing protein [Tuber indicum]|nr:kinase-like domain-containing protein [Tuber indicum]
MEATEAAPGALGVPGTVDICLRAGQNLCERYKDVQETHKDIEDLKIRVENVWLHIAYQLATVQSSSEEVHQVLTDHIAELLNKLQFYLFTACKNLEKLKDKKGRTKVIKFALFLKGSLRKDVSVLERWRDMFNSTFYMLSVPKNPALDQILSMELQKSQPDGSAVAAVNAIRDVLADEPTKQLKSVWLDPVMMHLPAPIGYSGAQIILDNTTDTRYIMESITVVPGRRDYNQLDKDVTKLASVLRESNGVPGVLACKGVVRKQRSDGAPENFEFILEMPHGLDESPECLRTILQRSTNEPHPLDERVFLAKQIAKAALSVHNLNFVHKNMRPENILVFPNPGKTLGIPFLVGFQMFRSADGITYRTGDESWSSNLYRHPSRQGTLPDNAYRMQHDIYSLGVILLEIGLWSPFVNEEGEPAAALSQIMHILQDKDQRTRATRIKKVLMVMAYNYLPPRIGSKYTDIVISCLTCLDRDSELGSESEFLDDDGTLVGVRFTQQILGVLEEIDI